MATVTIDFEGDVLQRDLSPGATHVVVSRRVDGGLRIRGTRDPMNAIFDAKDAGDDSPRMATIEDGRASFAEVTSPEQSSPEIMGVQLSQWLRMAGLLALLAATIVLVVLVP